MSQSGSVSVYLKPVGKRNGEDMCWWDGRKVVAGCLLRWSCALWGSRPEQVQV